MKQALQFLRAIEKGINNTAWVTLESYPAGLQVIVTMPTKTIRQSIDHVIHEEDLEDAQKLAAIQNHIVDSCNALIRKHYDQMKTDPKPTRDYEGTT